MPVPSLWQSTADPEPSYPALTDEVRADVAIVGGGYTGLSAALQVAKDGRRAVVLEADHVGWGASGRNGGLVSGKFRVPFHVVEATHGREEARRLHHVGKQAVATLAELIDEHGIGSANFKMSGYITAAHSPRAFAAQRFASEWLADALDDTSSRILDPKEVAAEVGSSAYVGGVLNTAAGCLHPLNYVRGLARAATVAGVQIFEDSAARVLQREGPDIRVATSQGTVRARQLILATNGYSARQPLTRSLRQRLIPFRSAIVATAPLSDALRRRILPNRRVVADTRRLLRWYRIVDDRLVFGGRGAFGQEDSEAAFNRLARDMMGAFPELDGVKIDYRWSGLVAMTMDQLPHAGELEDRVFFAAGYNGTGIAMSSFLGRQLAALTRGEKLQLGLIGRPLKPIPLQAFVTPAVRTVTGWYQLLDAIGR
jgi:glycine/D-amino acid oxidase-like deaminating enzyme